MHLLYDHLANRNNFEMQSANKRLTWSLAEECVRVFAQVTNAELVRAVQLVRRPNVLRFS